MLYRQAGGDGEPMKKIHLKLFAFLAIVAIAAPVWAERPPLRAVPPPLRAVPHAPDPWKSTYSYDVPGTSGRSRALLLPAVLR